jgi:hypothetical protein
VGKNGENPLDVQHHEERSTKMKYDCSFLESFHYFHPLVAGTPERL